MASMLRTRPSRAQLVKVMFYSETEISDLIMIEIIACCCPASLMGKLARKTWLVVSVGHCYQWSGIKDISPSFRSNKTGGTN